jgi:hypothetical protein
MIPTGISDNLEIFAAKVEKYAKQYWSRFPVQAFLEPYHKCPIQFESFKKLSKNQNVKK